jgi:nucleotide-binding universal stress UspA family protein
LNVVLLAYDASPSAERALQHAADLIRHGGSIGVINVIPIQSISARLETVRDDERARQARILNEATASLARRGLTSEVFEAAGDPATEILAAAAATHADVLVVGRGGSRKLLPHGSLSSRIVRGASCDVLVVR